MWAVINLDPRRKDIYTCAQIHTISHDGSPASWKRVLLMDFPRNPARRRSTRAIKSDDISADYKPTRDSRAGRAPRHWISRTVRSLSSWFTIYNYPKTRICARIARKGHRPTELIAKRNREFRVPSPFSVLERKETTFPWKRRRNLAIN